MATNNTIRIKKRAAGGAAGAPSSLASAEPAYNEQDNTLYYGFGDNGSGVATSVVPIAGKGAFADLSSAQTLAGVKTFSSSPVMPTPATADNSTNAATTAYVQSNLLSYAPLASPTLTGTPLAPTPSTADNTTKIATTAFVQSNLLPYAPLASPALTGTPTAPTATAGNNTTQVATTAFVQTAVGSNVTGNFSFLGTIAASGSLPTPSVKGFYIVSTAGTFTGTSVALNVGDQIIYDQNAAGDLATNWDYIRFSGNVASVFGRTGVVVAASGDYNTAQVTESTNLYFTAARVLAVVLTGLSTATNAAILATDTILVSLGKLQAQVTARLIAANNLSDLTSASTARTNLGLGTAATLASTAVAQTANNLSDLASAATARTNLGLGGAATQANAFFLQTANNLSDVVATTARTNLGLADMATQSSTGVSIAGGTISGTTITGGTF